MNKVLMFVLLFAFQSFNAQTAISEVEKCKQLGLVWGLMKYHHPDVSKGKYDWDSEFIKMFDQSVSIDTQEKLNGFLLENIQQFGMKPKYKARKIKLSQEHLFTKNVDYQWIDSKVFGKPLTHVLLEMKDNGNVGDYYASVNKFKTISFENEKGLKEFDVKIKSHRLLLFYSFWNAIEYWNVNKYLTDQKWMDVPDEMTEEFLKAKSEMKFELAKSKMISKLNDSHSYYMSKAILDSLRKRKPCFSYKIVNDTITIVGAYKSLAHKEGIALGDQIVKVNHEPILPFMNKKVGNLISVSNPMVLKRAANLCFLGTKDSVNVDVVSKNGVQRNIYIHFYEKIDDKDYEFINVVKRDKWTFIKPNIAYVNLEEINEKELSTVFKQAANTKGLILDLRNYPKSISNSDLAKYLYPERKEFVKVLFPVGDTPSIGEYDGSSPLDVIVKPFKAGGNNPNYYKGKIILIVNRWTQSKAEFIGMSIQQAPNCITIGEQTAGSVMNVVPYILTDKTMVKFTGLGGFYPNGEGVQRKGLHIDHYIEESAKNYDPELYVKEAIKLIEE